MLKKNWGQHMFDCRIAENVIVWYKGYIQQLIII